MNTSNLESMTGRLIVFILPHIYQFTTKLPGWLCTALSVQLLQENKLRF